MITGEIGYDTALHWVSVKDRLGYTIQYENDPEFATATAQDVRIELPVDSGLNIYSVRLGDFGFGAYNYQVPENTIFYQQRLTNTADSLGVYVDVTAGVDVVNHKVFWLFESILPATGLSPDDPFVGFLPVNDSITNPLADTLVKRGEGYVMFSILPKSTLVTGDSVKAKAAITFNINAPIETNTWKNLIDAFPPTSQMNPLPGISPANAVWLTWTGTDDPGGVGIAHYDLYVSKNDGPYLPLASYLDTTAYQFVGTPGSTYEFYTRATDHVGNTEAEKTTADEVITLGGGCVPNLSLTYPVLFNGIYRSQGQLTASTAVITDTQNISFRSDVSIVLQGNFTVEKGAVFEAVIEACPPNFSEIPILKRLFAKKKIEEVKSHQPDE